MSDTLAPGGAAGALSSGARRLAAVLGKIEVYAVFLVLFAGLITTVKKNWTGELWSYAVWFGITLGVATLLYEMIAAKKIARAFYNAKLGALTAAAFIWICAFSYSVNQWIGAASENQAEKTNVHKAAYLKTVTSQDQLAAAKAEYERMQKRLDWMATAVNGQPVRTPEAAQASMDNAKSNRFWTLTKGCAETKGSKTRAFCDGYRSAEAELALAIERATLVEEIKGAKATYEKASAIVASTPVETSEARNDLFIYTDWMGLSETDASRTQGLLAIIAISIFLTYASMANEWQRLTAEKARQRFNILTKLRRAWSRFWHGREPGDMTVLVEKYETKVEPKFQMKKIEELMTMTGQRGALA